MILRYQEGNKIPTTRQDSLNLYNNTNELLDYYIVEDDKYRSTTNRKYEKLPLSDFEREVGKDPHYVNQEKRELYKAWIEAGGRPRTNRYYNNIPQLVVDGLGLMVGIGSDNSTITWEDKDFTYDDYYRKLDGGNYEQRELHNSILDIDAPRILYNSNINPSTVYKYGNLDNSRDGWRGTNPLLGDVTMFYGYDPLQVKPWDMLTPEERELRIQKYGYDGAPAPRDSVIDWAVPSNPGAPTKELQYRKFVTPKAPLVVQPETYSTDTVSREDTVIQRKQTIPTPVLHPREQSKKTLYRTK